MTVCRMGGLEIGRVPRVVGTVARAETLKALVPGSRLPCDIVELRLDLAGTDRADLAETCRRVEASGRPVIVTIRLASEGGGWTGPDEARVPLFRAALENASAVDVELRSAAAPAVCSLAASLGKCAVVSHHDFERMPDASELRRILAAMRKMNCSIAKIAVRVGTEAELKELGTLVSENKATGPLCAMGMGALGPKSRIVLPAMGSCLTYGYLDEPVASGQVECGELAREFGCRLKPAQDAASEW